MTILAIICVVLGLVVIGYKTKTLVLIISGIVSLAYVPTIIWPLVGCNGICTGTDTVAWSIAFFYSPIGIPAMNIFYKKIKERRAMNRDLGD